MHRKPQGTLIISKLSYYLDKQRY